MVRRDGHVDLNFYLWALSNRIVTDRYLLEQTAHNIIHHFTLLLCFYYIYINLLYLYLPPGAIIFYVHLKWALMVNKRRTGFTSMSSVRLGFYGLAVQTKSIDMMLVTGC